MLQFLLAKPAGFFAGFMRSCNMCYGPTSHPAPAAAFLQAPSHHHEPLKCATPATLHM